MQTPQLELHKELVQSALDSTSYVLHAKGSADEIEEVTVEGLKLTEQLYLVIWYIVTKLPAQRQTPPT